MVDQLLGSLNIDPTVLLLNGILFLVLLAILNAIFWKPMMAHLEKRKHEISDAYKAVDDTRREMENLRLEYQGRLATIEADARGRIQDTVRDAQHQRESMIAEARAHSERLMLEGAQEIEQEKQRTLSGMRETLDNVALAALSKAISAPTDASQKALVDEYVASHIRTS